MHGYFLNKNIFLCKRRTCSIRMRKPRCKNFDVFFLLFCKIQAKNLYYLHVINNITIKYVC